jgi:hypothetical protein
MDWTIFLGILLILYGAACFYVAFAKPSWAWKTGKFRGFIEILGESGTIILLVVIGVLTLVGGLLIIL